MFSSILIIVVVTALLFEFINGFHDTANAIAVSVYTKALSPRNAIMLAAAMNFAGALVSDKVAKTISSGLVNTSVSLEQYVILAALLSAIIWDLFTWWKAIPCSSSHALIGGLLGASMGYAMSTDVVIWSGVWEKVLLPLLASPIIGFVFGYGIMQLIFLFFANWKRAKVNRLFLRFQIISSALVAFSHGSNDAQKTMGIITMSLTASGLLGMNADVPFWVKLACAIAITIGTSVGGWKIMKTMGGGVTKLEPESGFAAQMASTSAILIGSQIGAPVSTTHIITASIMGAGSVRRFSAVKWGIARSIITAWVTTLPVTMALGAGLVFLLEAIVK